LDFPGHYRGDTNPGAKIPFFGYIVSPDAAADLSHLRSTPPW
jgi:hypothetical protein